MPSTNSGKIQALNDRFRQTFQGGSVMMTRGIQALGAQAVAEILDKVRSFDAFTPDNDPYTEHDFGSFKHDGQKVFFKIDYYDQKGEFASPNPADPTKTNRVLTVMLAEEY